MYMSMFTGLQLEVWLLFMIAVVVAPVPYEYSSHTRSWAKQNPTPLKAAWSILDDPRALAGTVALNTVVLAVPIRTGVLEELMR